MPHIIQTALGTHVLSTISDVTTHIIHLTLGTHVLSTISDVTVHLIDCAGHICSKYDF